MKDTNALVVVAKDKVNGAFNIEKIHSDSGKDRKREIENETEEDDDDKMQDRKFSSENFNIFSWTLFG